MKKKVMDCRLQIAELESRLKAFESTKQELSDCQAQCDRVRMTLESSEAKLADAERRADEANGLIKIKDSVILRQSNFTKEMEERLRNVTEERDSLLTKSANLEIELNTAILRGEDADELREKLKKLEELFNKLVSEKSETTSESGLAAANEFFKGEQTRYEDKIAKLKETKAELQQSIERQEQDKCELLEQMEKHMDDYEKLSDKCATLEARIKEMAQSERRYRGGMMGSRLIGPTMPPWITDEKKIEDDLERLSKADPATLRAKVMELESQLVEANQKLVYHEDMILRIHEEIGRKASKLEAAEVERSSLNAQVSILKRELATAREDLSRRGMGPADLEAEIERLRGKRDREYQRRKRIEVELDEVEKENQEIKQRMRRLEEAVANTPAPKPQVPQSDPSDRNRIIELQGTVNQLRMDNEAKRSELFDLRSRFDAKSAQMDKIAAELKTKERSTGELTTQLNSVRTQLESTTKELETLRCRAVRGGAEVERWHADLTSLQVTNKFLSTQLNSVRAQMIAKERHIAELTRRCQQALISDQPPDQILVNGVLDDSLSPCSEVQETAESKEPVKTEAPLPQKETQLSVALAEAMRSLHSMEKVKSELDEQLKLKETRISQLVAELEEMRRVSAETKSQLESLLKDKEETIVRLKTDVNNVHGDTELEEERLDALLKEANEAKLVAQSREKELMVRLAQKEQELAQLTKETNEAHQLVERETAKIKAEAGANEQHLTELLHEANEARLLVEESKAEVERKLSGVVKKLSDSLKETENVLQATERGKHELDSKLSVSIQRAAQLSEDISRERIAVEAANTKIQLLTAQVNELSTDLSSTRIQLSEVKSAQRKADSEAATPVTSPPAKRTRRTAAKPGPASSQDCASCMELKKQISDLENDVSEYGSRENALTSQVNELRQQVADADTNAADLRRQLSTVHQGMSNAVV